MLIGACQRFSVVPPASTPLRRRRRRRRDAGWRAGRKHVPQPRPGRPSICVAATKRARNCGTRSCGDRAVATSRCHANRHHLASVDRVDVPPRRLPSWSGAGGGRASPPTARAGSGVTIGPSAAIGVHNVENRSHLPLKFDFVCIVFFSGCELRTDGPRAARLKNIHDDLSSLDLAWDT